jgi:hypothetical protein
MAGCRRGSEPYSCIPRASLVRTVEIISLRVFPPKSSLLSPLADDIIARAARHIRYGTIVLVQASSYSEAGETPQTAVERGYAVRLELIRNGVPASAIRMMYAGVSRTGIESRSVIISVIPAAPSSPPVATRGAAPAAGFCQRSCRLLAIPRCNGYDLPR